jgi:hypothetical protein
MSDKRNENTDKKGTCVYEKGIHVSHKGQGVPTNRGIQEQPVGIPLPNIPIEDYKNNLLESLYLRYQ